MAKPTTLTAIACNPIGDKQLSITTGTHGGGSDLLERVMKTIHKIAIASAIASSAFVFTATPGSAQRPPRQQFCLSYSQGGTDCSFTSYAQCEATASGQSAECYDNTPSDDEGFRGARAQYPRPGY